MNPPTPRLRTLAGLAAALWLAACAAPAPQPPAATQTAETSQRKPEKRMTTGSRLPASDSTQIVRTISGLSADETLRNQPNPGRPGN